MYIYLDRAVDGARERLELLGRGAREREAGHSARERLEDLGCGARERAARDSDAARARGPRRGRGRRP